MSLTLQDYMRIAAEFEARARKAEIQLEQMGDLLKIACEQRDHFKASVARMKLENAALSRAIVALGCGQRPEGDARKGGE